MSPFIESIRAVIRTKQYSLKTEKSYLYWARYFICFHHLKHPNEMGNKEVETFLSHLAVSRGVSAATQNQALCAIVFMYKHVLDRELTNLKFGYAKKPRNLPTVLNAEVVKKILKCMSGKNWLIIAIVYGCGLRVHEALRLRVKDIDLINQSIFVFGGKGRRDRYTLLQEAIAESIKK